MQLDYKRGKIRTLSKLLPVSEMPNQARVLEGLQKGTTALSNRQPLFSDRTVTGNIWCILVVILAVAVSPIVQEKIFAASDDEQEKEILRHAGSVCIKSGNALMDKLSDRQVDALFSPVFATPSGDFILSRSFIFVGEPINNPREWNAYARYTDQGHVCMILTDEMVRSFYHIAKIQVSYPSEQCDALIDGIASRVAHHQDLGQLADGLKSLPQAAVDQTCSYLASGLVAHEMAHIYLGHLGSALRAKGLSVASSVEEVNKTLQKLAYIRAQETEADIAALDNAIRVHPNMALGMLYSYDFMTRIQDKIGTENLPEVFLDHPHAKNRMGYLLNRLVTVHHMNVTAVLPRWFLMKYNYTLR